MSKFARKAMADMSSPGTGNGWFIVNRSGIDHYLAKFFFAPSKALGRFFGMDADQLHHWSRWSLVVIATFMNFLSDAIFHPTVANFAEDLILTIFLYLWVHFLIIPGDNRVRTAVDTNRSSVAINDPQRVVWHCRRRVVYFFMALMTLSLWCTGVGVPGFLFNSIATGIYFTAWLWSEYTVTIFGARKTSWVTETLKSMKNLLNPAPLVPAWVKS